MSVGQGRLHRPRSRTPTASKPALETAATQSALYSIHPVIGYRAVRGLARLVLRILILGRRDLHQRLLARRHGLRLELDELTRAAFGAEEAPRPTGPDEAKLG